MCDELSRSLTPRLEAVGFTPPAKPFSRRTLKYEFIRHAARGTQVLEILFSKYRQPTFGVQIYVAPPGGLQALLERGGALLVGGVSSSPRGWRFSVQPFRAHTTVLQRLRGQSGDRPKEAVALFLSLVPEVEDWWTHQRATRHITVSTVNYPGTSRTSNTGGRTASPPRDPTT